MRSRIPAVLASTLSLGLVLGAPAHAAFPGANGRIAFATSRDDFEIHTMNFDGTSQTPLTNNHIDDSAPAWSPDGTKIAFETYRDGNGEIYTMNADGTNPTRLTNHDIDDMAPAWSPDGTKIAFVSGLPPEIYTMNADGTNRTRLTNNQGFDGVPAWSPDGTKIAFAASRTFIDPVTPVNIHTMNADGTNRTRLTDDGSDWAPAWSPDGTRIAFVRGGYAEIYTMNADGTNQARLTNDLAYDTDPDWQPIPGPQRSDYKNAAQFCKADRDFLGDTSFAQKYGGGANAYGKCVSQNH